MYWELSAKLGFLKDRKERQSRGIIDKLEHKRLS